MGEIRIDRISLRMRGIPEQTARAVAGGLGDEILKRLAASRGQRSVRNIRIDAVRSPHRLDAGGWTRAIADAIRKEVI